MQIQWRLLFLVAFVLPTHTVAWAVDKPWLEQKIVAYKKSQPMKAIVYGLWINGKPISVGAMGESMTNTPATTGMHFRVGGVAETVLTTVLMRLVEQKQLKLEDTIDTWLPHLPHAKKVTLKMLANSSSGYPDYVYNKKFIDLAVSHPFRYWSAKELIDFAFKKPVLFEPGQNQHYSHTNYVLLGDILEKVSKKPLHQLYKTVVFDQLGMKNTQFNLSAAMSAPVLHAFSKDRGVYEDATFWNPSWTGSSGAMSSTIEDLGKWGNAFLSSRILKKASTQQLRAQDTVGLGKNTEQLYFAMGFGVANGWLIQNPRFGGYSGIFAVLPEKNIVFIAYNTLKKSAQPSTGNLSMQLWKLLAKDLAPNHIPF